MNADLFGLEQQPPRTPRRPSAPAPPPPRFHCFESPDMTDAERRPMQRMIATGPRFARKGHGRPQEGGSHASQCHPQPEALQGLQCVVTTEPQKTSYWRAFPEFSEQYAPAREAGIRAGIHEIGGRNQTTARFPQAWLLMCNESAKKHNNGGRSEF